jgi:cob(I)alamin adenosyltransferase
MAYRIYTRSGDTGQTGLFGGARVAKDDLRVEAYGTVDELNSALGLASSALEESDLGALIQRIQSRLFDLGADLATPLGEGDALSKNRIDRFPSEETKSLESAIDLLESELPPLTRFILPGGTEAAARLHYARTVCRRAERRIVHLASIEQINAEIVRYINRLSDFLFVAARAANHRAGVSDIVWTPRKGENHA